jgi:Na+-transporting methylmalonyl-CoA/oxaloacetate decarboxylase gamma subunit
MSGSIFQNFLASLELLVGFVIVMLTLAVLWGLTALMGAIVARVQKPAPRHRKKAAKVAEAAEASPAPSPAEDEEVLVVVAAATALLLGTPRHRIIAVSARPSAWGQQGQRDIHDSRRLR